MGRLYITALMVLMLLVLSSCGEEKECPASCDDGNPCSTDSCGKDTGYECEHAPIAGCTSECGVPCLGAVSQYMEMKCDSATKSCASDVKTGLKISTSAITNEMLSMGNKFKVITTFSIPFNIKKDLFAVKMSAVQFGTGISDIKIAKIELTGTDANRQIVSLGEKAVNKYIWSTNTVIDENVKIDFPTTATDGSFTNIKLRITYDYKQTYAGQVQTKTAPFEITLRAVTFTWLKPDMTQKCPTTCDDKNQGTADVCDASTWFFCDYRPIPGRCGNFVCEPMENKCSCELDCGPCTGDAGKYLGFICSDNQCRTMQKQGTIQQPVSITDDRNMNFFYLQNTYSYKEPFNVNKDKFTLKFSLYNKQPTVGTVTIVEAKILDLNMEVASVAIGQQLSTVGGSFTAEVPVTSFAGYESEKSLNLKVYAEYQYNVGNNTEIRKTDFTKPLGKVTFINPNLP